MLFNLHDDLSEKNNIAMQNPALVSELDELITKFLADTKAVLPVPNSTFDPSKYHAELEGVQTNKHQPKAKNDAKSPAKTMVKNDGDPALQGWKARACTAFVKDGILNITKLSDASFLGFSAAKISGPITVQVRLKSEAGPSHFDWLPGGVQSAAQSVSFKLVGGDWQELSFNVPASGPLGIVRLYLPKQVQPVEIDWIEITPQTGASTRTNF